MSKFAVITQNDESVWNDIKGDIYHYPNKYKNILTPGCKVIYYKGGLKNKIYKEDRLSSDPHYFGVGIIGDSILDSDSGKNDRYCEILKYKEFEKAVPNKINGNYLETIPPSKKGNYWRDGVRVINKATYANILKHTKLSNYSPKIPDINEEYESYGGTDGKKKQRFSSYYERNPYHRDKAIENHGLSCMVCNFNFEEVYGERGKGFIHVHHNKPLSESGETKINPKTDMSVLCPNCHAMIHRRKNHTLTLEDLKKLIKAD